MQDMQALFPGEIDPNIVDGKSIMETVVRSMAEGVVVQAQAGEILACNPSAERILGLTADQMKGLTSMDPNWRAIRDDGSPFPGEAHPSMITLETGDSCSDVIMGVHRPDYSLVWILVNSRPLGGETGSKPKAVVSTFTEITQLRRMREERERLADKLQRALTTALSGYIPICASCKKIRDSKSDWIELEQFINIQTGADFTHTMCPGCITDLYPELGREED